MLKDPHPPYPGTPGEDVARRGRHHSVCSYHGDNAQLPGTCNGRSGGGCMESHVHCKGSSFQNTSCICFVRDGCA